MGIRIHKRIGWGLKTRKNDKRLNSDKLQEIYEDQKTIKDFSNWVNNNRTLCIEVLESTGINNWILDLIKEDGNRDILFPFNSSSRKNKNPNLSQFITFPDDEYHHQAIVVSPIEMLEKVERYDDTIDYYESGAIAKNKILDLTRHQGIYPYIGMQKIPGKNIPEHLKEEISKIEKRDLTGSGFGQLVGWWDKKLKPIVKGDILDYFLTAYRPIIPESVILLTYYTEILTDFDNDIQNFRPMIYTYWA